MYMFVCVCKQCCVSLYSFCWAFPSAPHHLRSVCAYLCWWLRALISTCYMLLVRMLAAGAEMANAGGVDLSRKFVSESEIEEKRKQRQEEWEKVRKPDDPEGKTFHLCVPVVHMPNYAHFVFTGMTVSVPLCVCVWCCFFFVCFVFPSGPRGGVWLSIVVWATSGAEGQEARRVWGAAQIQWVTPSPPAPPISLLYPASCDTGTQIRHLHRIGPILSDLIQLLVFVCTLISVGVYVCEQMGSVELCVCVCVRVHACVCARVCACVRVPVRAGSGLFLCMMTERLALNWRSSLSLGVTNPLFVSLVTVVSSLPLPPWMNLRPVWGSGCTVC